MQQVTLRLLFKLPPARKIYGLPYCETLNDFVLPCHYNKDDSGSLFHPMNE